MHLQRIPIPRPERRVGGHDADRGGINHVGGVIDQPRSHQVGRRGPDHGIEHIRRARILAHIVIHAAAGAEIVGVIVSKIEPHAVDGVAIGRHRRTDADVGVWEAGIVGRRSQSDGRFADAGHARVGGSGHVRLGDARTFPGQADAIGVSGRVDWVGRAFEEFHIEGMLSRRQCDAAAHELGRVVQPVEADDGVGVNGQHAAVARMQREGIKPGRGRRDEARVVEAVIYALPPRRHIRGRHRALIHRRKRAEIWQAAPVAGTGLVVLERQAAAGADGIGGRAGRDRGRRDENRGVRVEEDVRDSQPHIGRGDAGEVQ